MATSFSVYDFMIIKKLSISYIDRTFNFSVDMTGSIIQSNEIISSFSFLALMSLEEKKISWI